MMVAVSIVYSVRDYLFDTSCILRIPCIIAACTDCFARLWFVLVTFAVQACFALQVLAATTASCSFATELMIEASIELKQLDKAAQVRL